MPEMMNMPVVERLCSPMSAAWMPGAGYRYLLTKQHFSDTPAPSKKGFVRGEQGLRDSCVQRAPERHARQQCEGKELVLDKGQQRLQCAWGRSAAAIAALLPVVIWQCGWSACCRADDLQPAASMARLLLLQLQAALLPGGAPRQQACRRGAAAMNPAVCMHHCLLAMVAG